MVDVGIFFANETNQDAELLEYEAIAKGYRKDVYVKIGKEYYNVAVFDIKRLVQNFESEQSSYGYFTPDVNLVLVSEASKRNIVDVINKLNQNETFFEKLKPTEDEIVLRLRSHDNEI